MKILASLVLVLTGCASYKPHVDVMAGTRTFGHTDWEQTNSQAAIGVQANFAGKNGIGPEIAIILSDDTSNDDTYVNRSVDYTKSRIEEVSLGLRKNVMLGEYFQAYLSGGLSATTLHTTAGLDYDDSVEDYSVAYAPYAQAGLNYLFKSYTCGVLYRRSFWGEDESAFVNDPSTDSDVIMFTLGYSF